MKILDIIREAADTPVYVIGDSIAVGIKNAGNAPGIAVGGKNPTQVLGYVKDFVASGKAKGAIVILSSGASNGTFERPTGEKQNLDMAPIEQQLKLLKDAGATVVLVGTGSEKSKTVTNSLGTYFVNFKDQNVNQKLASAASTYSATFLGPLEKFDPNMNSGKGDGIHPFNGYNALFQAGSAVNPKTEPDKKDNKEKTDAGIAGQKAEQLTSIEVPSGRRGTAVADIQKVLLALGYDLGPRGVDGIRGPYTSKAVKQFQEKLGVKVDGDPGPETVAAMNKFLQARPELTSKITKSTPADVKAPQLGGSDTASVGELLKSNDATVQEARESAEKYLGRKMSDEEWTALVKVTGAEEGSVDGCGYVMGAILNRVNKGTWGSTVMSVVTAPYQFQPVTGASGRDASRLESLPITKLRLITTAAIKVLPSVPHGIVNFTSNIDAAYQGRDSIKYKKQLLARGGDVHGQSVFSA